MTEEAQMYIDDAKESMIKAIAHLEEELTKVRAGKANVSMLNGIFIDYYGVKTALNQVANVSCPDARSLVIKPWEKSTLELIEKAINAANLGFNPMNDGELIRINIPPLTEERRLELVKTVKSIAEHSKISIRNIRRDANDGIRALVKEGLSEDLAKDGEAEVQQLTDEYTSKIDKHVEAKDNEIMTI